MILSLFPLLLAEPERDPSGTLQPEPEPTVVADEPAPDGPAMLHKDPSGFGIGLVLGIPTGLTMAWRPSAKSPIWFDAAVAWSFDKGAFLVQGDVLWTITRLRTPDWEDISFPVYIGVGPRFSVGDGSKGTGLSRGDDAYLGVRVPIGMQLHHKNVPIEGFLEVGPGMRIVPETSFLFDIGIGGRFYFGP